MKVIKPNTIDITTDGSFTRSTTGTYFDVDGLMKTAAINAPRFDYDPFAKTFKGLILEAAATNLALYSQELLTGWTRGTGATWTSNQGVAPDGTTTALGVDNLDGVSTLSTANALHRVMSGLVAGTQYCFSIFVKPKGSSEINVSLRLAFVEGNTVISNKVIKPGAWNRIDVTAIAPADVTFSSILIGTQSGPVNVYIWGAQLEVGYYPTSYIPTTTSPVTRAEDIVTGSNLIYSTVTEATAAWSSGTTYALAAKVRYLNQIWESLQASNLNKAPNTNPTWWVLIGPDNLHAPFDLSVSTASAMPTIQTIVLKPGAFDALALVNVDAEVTEVGITDYNSKTIYFSNTYGLTGGTVFDWFSYFFDQITEERTQILVQGLSEFYPNAVITIRLRSAAGVNNKIGAIIPGLTTTLGGSQYGISAGITDYSRKETDEFGVISFIERNYSKRMSADVHFANSEINKVQRFLYSIRATPVVWVGSDDPTYEEPLVVFGFYRDFSTTIAYPSHSLCSLEIEGLT